MESGALFVCENSHFFIPVILLDWAKSVPIKFSEEKKEKRKDAQMDIQGLPWPDYQEGRLSAVLMWDVAELTWA